MTVTITLLVRLLLVILFLPFSALDKILNFGGAVAQAQQIGVGRGTAMVLIAIGLAVEIVMPLGILTGIADRLAAFVLAGYCCATALLWKRFWQQGDFWHSGESKAREMFWDFLKNYALAGGFLLLASGGATRAGVAQFLHHPFASSHPYAAADDR